MLAEEIRALENHWFEAMNKGIASTISEIDENCAPNVIFHSGLGRDLHGINDFKQLFNMFFNAIPDIHFTLEDLIVAGDKAVVRYTFAGTHKGELMGIAPTNKKVTVSVIEIDHIVGGRLVEGWSKLDTIGFMQQLGVIPTPGK